MRALTACFVFALFAACSLHAAADEPTLKAMTFNIRYGSANDGEHSWPNRREAVVETIRRADADIVGVQEALAFQLDYLGEQLPQYESVGVGRDDGRRKGEHSAILLRRSRFDVIDSGTRWLSDQPARPGSITWRGKLPRVYTWAELQDKDSGQRVHVVNTHWDHQSQESREKSAAAIAAHLAERDQPHAPAVVMGDLNADPKNAALRRLASDQTGLRDAWRLANASGPRPATFHGFRGSAEGPFIDWVLVSPEWRVSSARVVTDKINGQVPSDHYPVVVELGLLN